MPRPSHLPEDLWEEFREELLDQARRKGLPDEVAVKLVDLLADAFAEAIMEKKPEYALMEKRQSLYEQVNLAYGRYTLQAFAGLFMNVYLSVAIAMSQLPSGDPEARWLKALLKHRLN